MNTPTERALLFVTTALLCAASSNLAAAQSGPTGSRPIMTFDEARDQPGLLRVKFRDGLSIRLRGGEPRDLLSGSPVFAPGTFDGAWSRTHQVPERELEVLRERASAARGRSTVDHNLEFDFRFEAHAPDALIRAFHADPRIEYARPAPRAFPLPGLPDYEDMQGYLNSATDGVGADDVRHLPGGEGWGVAIADIEYSWFLPHQDLPSDISFIGPPGSDPFGDDNHGTAVLGELFGVDNDWGVTGIAPRADGHVVAANTILGYNLASAILLATNALEPGDTILIEQQTDGPGPASDDYVPSEWILPVYNAIQTAVGNGIIVVEAAANGGWNLDHPIFSQGNGGHWPFLPGNDSGAILVGAGGAPGSVAGDRSRLDFSSYGTTVDLQGWGHLVTTTGYGHLYSINGPEFYFTSGFSGTSSASPIVAGACALLQTTYFAQRGAYLSPSDVRAYLRASGSPQLPGGNPASENIGPRPDVPAGLELALGTWVDFDYAGSLELGTLPAPYDTLTEGIAATPDHEDLFFISSSDSWTGSIGEPLVLRSWGGPTVIGQR